MLIQRFVAPVAINLWTQLSGSASRAHAFCRDENLIVVTNYRFYQFIHLSSTVPFKSKFGKDPAGKLGCVRSAAGTVLQQQSLERFATERLGQVVVHTSVSRGFTVRFQDVCRDCNDGNVFTGFF